MAALLVIVVLCTAVEMLLSAADLGLIGARAWRSQAYENGAFWVGLLRDWQPNYAAQPAIMFVSYAFLHAGIIHLLVNMFTLISLGAVVLNKIGQRAFVFLYAVSAIGGGAGFAALSQEIQPMVGASGALFGMAGALVAWEYSDRKLTHQTLRPVAQFVMFLVAYNFVIFWATGGQLAWQAHLGGFISGLFFALLKIKYSAH